VRRVDVLALGGVAVLLGAAFLYGQREPVVAAAPPELVALQQAADLEPCPPALTPDLAGVTLRCLGGGREVHLGGRPPGPLLLNIWGSWCAPCVQEVPDLVAFAERARGRVGVVGVLTEDTQENGLQFARQFGMHYPNVVDEQGLVRARYGTGAPLTVFLDSAGVVRHVEVGKVASLAEFEALTATYLGVRL